MTQKRFSIRRILGNNKIVLVFSFLLAVVIWLIVAMQFSDQQETTFVDVPVTIDTKMSDSLGLQIFGQKNLTVSIRVSGKRYDISPLTLSQDDFIVTASTVNASSAGKHTMPITVRTKDTSRNVEIVSFSPESVEAYFDYNLTENYPIEIEIDAPDGNVAADGYIDSEPLISNSTVTVSGAAGEMQNIAKVLAKVSVEEPLEKTKKFDHVSLAIVNGNGGIIRSSYVQIADNNSEVTVTVPIFKITQFTPSIRFKNMPSYFSSHRIAYTCTPSGEVNAAVSTELLDNADSLSLGTIDFADIHAGANTFSFSAKDNPTIRILDDVDEFQFRFSLDGFQSRTFTLTSKDIELQSLPDGVKGVVSPDTALTVTVVGLESELQNLTADSIRATANASGLTAKDDPYSLSLTFAIDGTTSCWVSGRASVDVTVS